MGHADPDVLEQALEAEFRDGIDVVLDYLWGESALHTIVAAVNSEIELINHFYGSDTGLINQLAGAQKRILKLLEKQLKIVPKNHYLNLWMVLGMSAFGVPLGVVWGTASGNIANLGIGLPIGMAIGIAVGAALDVKARREGRQLDLDLKC